MATHADHLRPMALRIVHYNNPVLRTKGEKVNAFDAALAKFAADMIDAMHEAGGIGLAAQQVGRPVQVCVVDLRESDAEFTWRSEERRVGKECRSRWAWYHGRENKI